MENLDIEKLERKNIYQAPDNVFAKVQDKVLQEIAPKKSAKIVKLNWIYSAAAAVALLFGFTFFINNSNEIKVDKPIIAKVEANPESDSVTKSLSVDKEEDELVKKSEISDENQFVAKNEVVMMEKNPVKELNGKMEKSEQRKTRSNQTENAIPMDQILASFTSADLADLNKNSEQDVYLDLYN